MPGTESTSCGFSALPKLRDRHKLAFDWIPNGCPRVLDGGCAYGSGTAPLAAKAIEVFGCDPNPDLIAQAKTSHPSIRFDLCPLEKTPYPDEFFSAITLTDVLEHVADEKSTLDELFRILKPGGVLIITTPHKGLFGFMDTDNYAWHLRDKLPGLYRRLYQMKNGKLPQSKAGYSDRHRHYSQKDLVALLDQSRFRSHYRLDRVFRGGLLAQAIASNVYEAVAIMTGAGLASRLVKPFIKLADWDYFIGYGPLSNHIAIRVLKLSEDYPSTTNSPPAV